MSARFSAQQLAAINELHKRKMRSDLTYFAQVAIKDQPGGEENRLSACHRLLLSKLEDLASGRLKKSLMVFFPSGAGKSTLLSKIFPAWWMANHPQMSVLAASHTADFAENKISREVMKILTTHKDALGCHPLDENKKEWRGSNGTTYRAAGVGAHIIGERCDLGIIDDPFGSSEDAERASTRDAVHNWYRKDFLSRLKPGAKVILMHQRVHLDDLAGRLLLEEPDDWEVLFLPAIWEGLNWDGSPLEIDAIGRRVGEQIWPEVWSLDWLAQKRRKVGPEAWSSMFQQRPVPAGGATFRMDQVSRIPVDAVPANPKKIVRAWDLAATENGGDFTSGTRMQRNRNDSYTITDQIHVQLGPEGVRKLILETAKADGADVVIALAQDPGAAGKMVVHDLVKALAGYTVVALPMSQRTGKQTMARPLAAQLNIGNVNIVTAPWNQAWLDEMTLFPGDRRDDQVDSTSLAFANLIDLPPKVSRPKMGVNPYRVR